MRTIHRNAPVKYFEYVMTDVDPEKFREALKNLPQETSHGDSPSVASVYLPQSHIKALHPDRLLVTGMRGAGKTFWWSALQQPDIRQYIEENTGDAGLNMDTRVHAGFGAVANIKAYPGKDVLQSLMGSGDMAPRTIWRTVQAWQLAPEDHDLRKQPDWSARTDWVAAHPESIDRLFDDLDRKLAKEESYYLILFDALDRCADDWQSMYRLIRGLLQTALDMRGYRRLRVKVFLRSDQLDEARIADFPDASKVLSSGVELNWPRYELYGMLWHYLANAGEDFRDFLRASEQVPDLQLFVPPRRATFPEEWQRERFHDIAGQWMGSGPRRGFPYTWIPNHLGDTAGRVSPRSFLAALRTAAEDTYERYPHHDKALHYDSIKRGVQKASTIRVQELQEDYPWVNRLLEPLAGMVVPCDFQEVEQKWRDDKVLDSLREEIGQGSVKLPPRHIDQGIEGVRGDIESLGIFQRMRDGRVNIPDVFRVGYRLGRRGGVRPV